MTRGFLYAMTGLAALAWAGVRPVTAQEKKANWLTDGGDPQRTSWQKEETTALATYEAQGTRWILATATNPAPASRGAGAPAGPTGGTGSLVAFKLVDQGGALSLEKGWTSPALVSPLGPIVVNGVVFVASSGEFKGTAGTQLTASQRAQRSTPAVLYALDAASGKPLWNSGRTITSFARAALSAGAGQVYLVTYDNTLYAFGIPMEH
jgi:outer membrane protein assembly factor BamB